MHHDTPDDLGGLLMHATRSLRRRWAEALEPLGVSPHEFRALSTIDRSITANGQGPRVGVIAQELRITPRSATEVIDALESHGLVVREPDPTDRRAVIVLLTEQGRTTLTTAGEARHRSHEEQLSRLTADEREELALLLRRVIDTASD